MSTIQKLKEALDEIQVSYREIDTRYVSNPMERSRVDSDKIFLMSLKVKALAAMVDLEKQQSSVVVNVADNDPCDLKRTPMLGSQGTSIR